MPSPPRVPGPGRFVPRVTPRIAIPRVPSSPQRPATPPGPVVVARPPGTALDPRRFDPEPPIPREPPEGLGDSKQAVSWLVSAIHAHERLRDRSFYDTGHLIGRLLELRESVGARDIKDLCSKVDLGLSHMTANKYLQVARTFDRDTAVPQGIEKCYALVLYAKAIGRAGQAAAILSGDEVIRGGERNLRAKAASASKIYDAVKTLKDAAKERRVPEETRAAAEKATVDTGTLFRTLGIRRAHTELVRRGGVSTIAVYIPLDVATGLEAALPRALARYGTKLARTRPELFEPLRAAGWKVGRSRQPTS